MSTAKDGGVDFGDGESLDDQSDLAAPLYETKTLMCKNNCGYYGNPIQYEGYCSICYRKLKQYQQNQHHHLQQQAQRNFVPTASSSFDDASSLLTSSVSLNNGFYGEDSKK